MKHKELIDNLSEHLNPKYDIITESRSGSNSYTLNNAIALKKYHSFSKWPKFMQSFLRNNLFSYQQVAWIERPSYYKDNDYISNKLFVYVPNDAIDFKQDLEKTLFSFKDKISSNGENIDVKLIPNYEQTLEDEFKKYDLKSVFVDSTREISSVSGLTIIDAHYLFPKDSNSELDVVGVFLSENPLAKYQLGYSAMNYSSMDLLLTNSNFSSINKHKFIDVFDNLEKLGFKGRIFTPEEISGNELFHNRLFKNRYLLNKLNLPNLKLPC